MKYKGVKKIIKYAYIPFDLIAAAIIIEVDSSPQNLALFSLIAKTVNAKISTKLFLYKQSGNNEKSIITVRVSEVKAINVTHNKRAILG